MNLDTPITLPFEEWTGLRTFFAAAAALPSTGKDFEDRYGPFSEPAVYETIAAIADIQAIALQIGEAAPAATTQHAQPPAEAYAWTVWLTAQVAAASTTIAETLQLVGSLVHTGVSAPERAHGLRQILAGSRGVAAAANQIRSEVACFRAHLLGLQRRLEADVRSLAGSPVFDLANRAIGTIENTKKRLAASADGGTAEALERDLASKQRMVAEFQPLFGKLSDVVRSMQEIDAKLARVERLFGSEAGDLTLLCEISNTQQLSDPGWVTRALDLSHSAARWEEIARIARQFVSTAVAAA